MSVSTKITQKIHLARPYLPAATLEYIQDVLFSGHLTEGAVTKLFEAQVADFLEIPFVSACCNCTVGLEIALRALGVGVGDEVIVPDFTYPATVAAVNIVGAKAVLTDIDRSTLLLDIQEVEKNITKKTRAIIPVSLFGNPIDYDRFLSLKARHKLFLIEDAACALGAEVSKRKTGTFADITVFSLHPRKFVTTGEGGLIVTSDPDLAAWIDSYKHFGMQRGANSPDELFGHVGTNSKLSDILAAIGVAQMEMVDQLLERRRQLADRYSSMLDGVNGVTLPQVTVGGTHSYQTYCVQVNNRDQVRKRMAEYGVETQIGSYALHRQKAFSANELYVRSEKVDNSNHAYHHCLALPLYHEMSEQDQEYVISKLIDVLF